MGTKPSLEGDNDALNVSETQDRFKDRPWDYLESEGMSIDGVEVYICVIALGCPH